MELKCSGSLQNQHQHSQSQQGLENYWSAGNIHNLRKNEKQKMTVTWKKNFKGKVCPFWGGELYQNSLPKLYLLGFYIHGNTCTFIKSQKQRSSFK